MGEDLEARFKKAVWLIRNGPKIESSNDTKLSFYKYFKQVTLAPLPVESSQFQYFVLCILPFSSVAQIDCSAASLRDEAFSSDGSCRMQTLKHIFCCQATEGDVKGSQPWAAQFEKRAKHDAWASVKGMSKEEAMQNYVELLEDPDVWENHEKLKEYPGPQWMTT